MLWKQVTAPLAKQLEHGHARTTDAQAVQSVHSYSHCRKDWQSAQRVLATYIGGFSRVAFGSLLRVDMLQGPHFTVNGDAASGSFGKWKRGCEASGAHTGAPDSYAIWQNLTGAKVGLCLCQLLHHTLLPKQRFCRGGDWGWLQGFCCLLGGMF